MEVNGDTAAAAVAGDAGAGGGVIREGPERDAGPSAGSPGTDMRVRF